MSDATGISLQPKRSAAEGVPVAAILLLWTFVSWVFTLNSTLSGTARDAGVVMAVLYVVVRGARLAPEVSPPETDDLRFILRENARVAVATGAGSSPRRSPTSSGSSGSNPTG